MIWGVQIEAYIHIVDPSTPAPAGTNSYWSDVTKFLEQELGHTILYEFKVVATLHNKGANDRGGLR